MKLMESGEMYLETVYILSMEQNTVRSIDVAKHMGVTKASVSFAMRNLQDGGYLIRDANQCLLLTDVGDALARKIYNRNVTLTSFLSAIGVSDAVASLDACRLEHYISDESFQAIQCHLEHLRKKEL